MLYTRIITSLRSTSVFSRTLNVNRTAHGAASRTSMDRCGSRGLRLRPVFSGRWYCNIHVNIHPRPRPLRAPASGSLINLLEGPHGRGGELIVENTHCTQNCPFLSHYSQSHTFLRFATLCASQMHTGRSSTVDTPPNRQNKSSVPRLNSCTAELSIPTPTHPCNPPP